MVCCYRTILVTCDNVAIWIYSQTPEAFCFITDCSGSLNICLLSIKKSHVLQQKHSSLMCCMQTSLYSQTSTALHCEVCVCVCSWRILRFKVLVHELETCTMCVCEKKTEEERGAREKSHSQGQRRFNSRSLLWWKSL